jgi:lambda family phage portal protein
MLAVRTRDEAMPEFAGRSMRSVRNDTAIEGPTSDQRAPAPYEAGSVSRRFSNWRPSTVNPNALLGSLGTIRDRSRQATRNDPYAKGLLDKLTTNLVGTGITPRSQAKDRNLRKQIDALWLRWTDEADADGQLDFYGLQAQATRGFLEGGEMFSRKRPRFPEDGLSVPLQIQLLEPELCPHTHSGTAKNGNKIRAGIEFDGIGRRIAYHVHPTRPELDDYDVGQLKRIPSAQIDHLFDPLRAGQLRGLPIMTAVLVKLYELDKTSDARVLREQMQNMFAAFVTSDASMPGVDQIHPLTGQAISSDEPTLQFEPATIQTLLPGEDVRFSTPPHADNGFADFMRLHLRAACIGAGVPYEVATGDMTGMNDRTVRVVLNEFRRRLQMTQHQVIVHKWCRPIWNAWIDAVYFSQALPIGDDYLTDPTAYTAAKWAPARFPYLHPVQDVEADTKAILAGFTTRSAVVSDYGEDAEQIDEEQALDNERADEKRLKYTSDGRVVAGKAAAAPPPPPPDDDDDAQQGGRSDTQ